MNLLYHFISKSQVFHRIYDISTTFSNKIFKVYVNSRKGYPVVFLFFFRYLVANSYKYLHILSIPVGCIIPCICGVMETVRQNLAVFFPFCTGFAAFSGLTFEKKYDKFSLSAVTKTCVTGKIPREASVWCKDAVPLPVTIPLPSRVCGNAMPGAPVKASMSDGLCRNQGGTVEYFCIPPLIFQGMGLFFTFPQGLPLEGKLSASAD